MTQAAEEAGEEASAARLLRRVSVGTWNRARGAALGGVRNAVNTTHRSADCFLTPSSIPQLRSGQDPDPFITRVRTGTGPELDQQDT